MMTCHNLYGLGRRLLPSMVVLSLAAVAWAAEPNPPVAGVHLDAVHFPNPPRLAITAQAWDAQRQADNFSALRDAAVRQGDSILTAGVTVPRGYADWIFYYANPKTGRRLEPLSLTEHRDPVSGEVFTDEKIVGAYRMVLHDRLNNQVLQLAWAYRYSGDDRYAAAARDALLQLAQDYPTYPGRRDRWGRTGLFAPLGGRRYTQSLSEATGVIPLAEAYDLCRDSAAWSDEQRRTVEREFFAATADTLLRFNQGINNHQTWYNAGLMAIANVLGDGELVRRVVTMRGGYLDQLQRSLGDDGLWYEGALAYHFYALEALTQIVDAAAPLGLRLLDHPRLRLMFDAPLQAIYPNGQFPAINDSDPANIRGYGRVYGWARQRFNDPRYADPAAHLSHRSSVFQQSGLVALRRGQGEQAVCVMTDFGPHGAGHGHYDKLQLLLFVHGREWLGDPGRLTYSHPEYKTWVKHTAAHNTVTIDQRSQAATTGRLLWFQDDPDLAACSVESSGAYRLGRLRRTLVLSGDVLIDRFEVQAESPQTIDWLAHVRGREVQGVSWQPLAERLGDGDGYQHLTRVLAAQGELPRQGLRLTAASTEPAADSPPLVMWLLPSPGDQLLMADSIGLRIDEVVPCLVWRRQATDAVYLAVYDLAGGRAVQAIDADPQRRTVAITGSDGRTATFSLPEHGPVTLQRP